MNTQEIENTVQKDKCVTRDFLGVFPSDQLPKIQTRPCCFIANTDPSTKPGQHWIAMYFGRYNEYFDSYALEPQEDFRVYKPEIVSNHCLQSFDSAVCGEYCIYFLYKRGRGVPFATIIDNLRRKNNPDLFVKRYIDTFKSTGDPDCGQSCTCRGS